MYKKLIWGSLVNNFLYGITLPILYSEMMRDVGTKEMVALSMFSGYIISFVLAHCWIKNSKELIQWTPHCLVIDILLDCLIAILVLTTKSFYSMYLINMTLSILVASNIGNILTELKGSESLGIERSKYDRLMEKYISLIGITSSALSFVLDMPIFVAFSLRIVGTVVSSASLYWAYLDYMKFKKTKEKEI